ncbi:MAG: PqqD family protein, partial [Actinomycetota bacterium]|nr:PqqD family protein [Actinomycetota bacterium]
MSLLSIETHVTTRLLPNPDVLAQQVDDSMVLVHLETNGIFTLNSTGRRVWELLAGGRAVEELERALQEQYQVDQAQLHQEVTELLEMLRT